MTKKEFEKWRDEEIRKLCPDQVFGKPGAYACGPDYAKAMVGRVMANATWERMQEYMEASERDRDLAIRDMNTQIGYVGEKLDDIMELQNQLAKAKDEWMFWQKEYNKLDKEDTDG